MLVAAISSPWDFLLKDLVIFLKFPGKGGRRAEACSDDNEGGVNLLQEAAPEHAYLAEVCCGAKIDMLRLV